jgi:protein phosphatase PTC7
MGVADGVYMWKELGIDSGTMSRTLMETAMHLVQAGVEDVVQGRALVSMTVGCSTGGIQPSHATVNKGRRCNMHVCDWT